MYISWTNTDIAPIRQLVGVERISLLKPSKSAAVRCVICRDGVGDGKDSHFVL